MKRAVVSLAAGVSQLPLIAAAKRRGFAVVGVDRDPRAAGLVECDAHVNASTHAAEEVLAGLASLDGFQIEGVVARSSGPPILTAALVAEHLGLAGVRVDAAHAAVSKSGQRALAIAAGLRVPDARSTAPGGDTATPGPPPWVVKPRITRTGKQGVQRVDHVGNLAAAVREAGLASEDGCVELEAWVPGRDVVLAGLFQNSTWIPCATFEEDTHFDEKREAVGWGLAVPASIQADTARALERAAQAFVEVNRLGDGVAFLTFRVEDDAEPTFLEAHLDLGGDYVVDALLAECRLNELAIDIATRREVEAVEPAPARVLRFLFASDGGEHFQRLTAASFEASVVLDRPAGVGPRARVGYFLESTEGPEENRRWAEKVHALLERADVTAPR